MVLKNLVKWSWWMITVTEDMLGTEKWSNLRKILNCALPNSAVGNIDVG